MLEVNPHQIDAVLLDAEIVSTPHGERIVGKIFCDRKFRFRDGDIVRTSPLVNKLGDVMFTSNSVYKVVLK